ncbi:hypothetical protein QQF64_034247 [Cirrhinus molitorella]|uniref:Integrase catalytic domain-containing protein n=1 Tax=Cirrhinus molitorella TaxID=172907 RepID=A0ABR3MW73_9TELE
MPDTLSRSYPDTSPLTMLSQIKSEDSSTTFSSLSIEWSDIAKTQQEDPEIEELITKAKASIDPDPTQDQSSHSKQWSVIQKLATTGHPQTNLTERVNRTLKTMIASYVRDHHWDGWVAEFCFAINTAWQEKTGFTPAEVMLG